MSFFVAVFPLVVTLIALIIACTLGSLVEKLKLGFFVNLLAVVFLSPIPILAYVFSRVLCDGLL